MKDRFFRQLMMAATSALLLASCAGKSQEVKVYPIQDNVEPRIMARALFSASDELVASLGLEEGVPASVSAFLVETDGVQILFDAANGAPDSQLMPTLNSLEVAPDDIDFIYITHLHGDHFGGLVQKSDNGTDVAAFKNAILMIPQNEYDAWMSPSMQNARIVEVLSCYGDRVKTFGLTEELPNGVKAIPVPGHTPGHTAYLVGDKLIAGDIMHGVALQLENPEVCARFDMNQEDAIASRKDLIEIAKAGGLTMYGMHFPEPYYIQF